MLVYTGFGRNGEQIINTNNILLKVINSNFSTYNLLPCLNLLYIVSLFVYNVIYVATALLNGQVHTN